MKFHLDLHYNYFIELCNIKHIYLILLGQILLQIIIIRSLDGGDFFGN